MPSRYGLHHLVHAIQTVLLFKDHQEIFRHHDHDYPVHRRSEGIFPVLHHHDNPFRYGDECARKESAD